MSQNIAIIWCKSICGWWSVKFQFSRTPAVCLQNRKASKFRPLCRWSNRSQLFLELQSKTRIFRRTRFKMNWWNYIIQQVVTAGPNATTWHITEKNQQWYWYPCNNLRYVQSVIWQWQSAEVFHCWTGVCHFCKYALGGKNSRSQIPFIGHLTWAKNLKLSGLPQTIITGIIYKIWTSAKRTLSSIWIYRWPLWSLNCFEN